MHGLQTSFCIIRNTEYARGNTTIVVADLLRRWRNCSTSTSQLKVPRLLFTSHDQDSSSTSAHASCELCDGLSDFQTSHSLVWDSKLYYTVGLNIPCTAETAPLYDGRCAAELMQATG